LRKTRELERRLDRVTPPPKPNGREAYARARAVEHMTKEEKFSFIRAVNALEETRPPTEPTPAWLTTRPPDEQAAVKKYLGLLERFEKEGETEA